MERLIVIATGGALGALTRYGLSSLMNEIAGRPSVLGTLMANLTGAFLLGLVLGFAEARTELPDFWRTAGGIGFLGAYTTFSTFMFEAVDRLENGDVAFVFAYVGGSVVLGLALAYAGLVAGRTLA